MAVAATHSVAANTVDFEGENVSNTIAVVGPELERESGTLVVYQVLDALNHSDSASLVNRGRS